MLAASLLACDVPGDEAAPGDTGDADDDGPTVVEPYVADVGVYSEFLPYDEVAMHLPALARTQTELYLAMPSAEVGGEALEGVLREAKAQHVPVRAWLLLDDADGYWPGEDNLAAYDALVERFWAWNEAEDLGVEWITVDMEPPLETSNMLVEALESGDLSSVVPVLLDLHDPEEHAAASEAWAAAVDRWHARGAKVGVVGLPYILDDFGDDDPDVQDMFESPIVGIDWDEVGFLVYQTLYADDEGERLGPGLVRSYGETAVAQFGDRASIALGAVGTVGKNTSRPGYDTPEQLAEDVAAAWATGASKVHLFSLDGMAELGEVEAWLQAASGADPVDPGHDAEVERQREAIAFLDSI